MVFLESVDENGLRSGDSSGHATKVREDKGVDQGFEFHRLLKG